MQCVCGGACCVMLDLDCTLTGLSAHPPPVPGIVNSELLSWMPRGGAVINGARGKHLVESDLLAALDDGQVGGMVHGVALQAWAPLLGVVLVLLKLEAFVG